MTAVVVDEFGECIHAIRAEWCALCKAPHPAPAAPVPTVAGRPFSALYPGHCRGCNLPIEVSSVIVRMSDDSYRHANEGCVE